VAARINAGLFTEILTRGRGDRRGLSKEFILETVAGNFRQDEQDEQNT